MPFASVTDGRIVAPKLEYNVVEHCNYSCDQCSHFSPYLRQGFPALASFERDLGALAPLYHVGRFRFVGGEPLLRKDIADFIAAVARSGIADGIEICTNGSLLATVDDAVFRGIDRLSISWYPDARCDQGKIDLARRKCADFGVRLKVEKIDRFRSMQVDRPLEDAQLVDRIFRSCLIAHSWGCQTFHEGRFYLCSRAIFTGAYLQKPGLRDPGLREPGRVAPDFIADDGCPLHEPDLLARLAVYLNRQEPLKSCAYCLGTVGKYAAWRQLPPDERKAPARAGSDAAQRVATPRMRYLLGWARLEKWLLRRIPSPRLNRGLNLLKNLPIRD
jgi:hypothetical protein